MRPRRLPARQQLRVLYGLSFNARTSIAKALLGEEAAEMRRLQKAGRVVFGPWTYSRCRVFTDKLGTERLIVGNYSSIGGTYLIGGNHGPNRITTYPIRINMAIGGRDPREWPIPTGDTIVGSDVWTCENSLMLAGITIGDGAVVAAGSVVTKDVPPYAIVGGNPAQLIRYRFNEAQREALLEIRWWDWPEEKIRAAVSYFESDDVDAFIAYARGESPVLTGSATR
jgi:acetyltransferase-like isoleucine patch superfamily enzyme